MGGYKKNIYTRQCKEIEIQPYELGISPNETPEEAKAKVLISTFVIDKEVYEVDKIIEY
jgi:hypothetical protein